MVCNRSMVKDAYLFIAPILVLAAIFAFWNWLPTALLMAGAGFVGFFFRNPARKIPEGENLVVSPADGKIVKLGPLPEGDGEVPGGQCISIFLNIFDVHVNRAPIRGTLERVQYQRGRFKVAYDEEASKVNEQNILIIRGHHVRLVVKQIAGLIARRVVCWKKPGQDLECGELFGLIRFGSRVDVLLPKEVRIRVKVGQRVKGGSSILGEVC